MFDVAIFGGKRLDTVPVKFSEREKEFLLKIGTNEDRPLGYIIRELAFRGLSDYLKDSKIRANISELEILADKLESNNGQVIKTSSKIKIHNKDDTDSKAA